MAGSCTGSVGGQSRVSCFQGHVREENLELALWGPAALIGPLKEPALAVRSVPIAGGSDADLLASWSAAFDPRLTLPARPSKSPTTTGLPAAIAPG
jgi:hypothetical protein